MSTTQTILLGAIAGFTIYLGLPLGRVKVASLRTRAFLNAASAGILLFLLFEILAHATAPLEEALEEAADGEAAWGEFAALGLVYVVGFGAGLLSLLYLGRLWKRSAPSQRTIVGTSFSSTYLFVGCLALAAGALLYVIGEILPVGRRLSWEVTLWGLMAGFFLGLATELVLELAGA